jgi:hypothetical protein
MAYTPSSNAALTNVGVNSRLAIDNLLRRELKVGDPSDPIQVASALANRYQANSRAQAIDRESKGLPFLNTPIIRTADAPAQTASDVDLEQARSDVEMDLQELLSDNLTKDIRPELEGWQQVLSRAIEEGVSAARFGLDPQRRDVAFSTRRQLGEYARLSRLIGALTPGLNQDFRNLATSLDEVASVILVLMGESMANLGFSGGRFLLQVPYSELQARRDAVLNALRHLDNVSDISGAAGTWPRGLRSYRQINSLLEAQGQGELRSLLNEAELARVMDELVQLASGGTPRGLRAIGATAWAPLNRLRRFVQMTVSQVTPPSQEMTTLHEALLLFLSGFVPAGGFRLLRVARPAVLNYGLYGSSGITKAETRLMKLVNARGALARQLDQLTACNCDEGRVSAQVVLDKILFDVDRCIDYYSVGDAEMGLPEVRSAAVSYTIDSVLSNSWNDPRTEDQSQHGWNYPGGRFIPAPEFVDIINPNESNKKSWGGIDTILFEIQGQVRPKRGDAINWNDGIPGSYETWLRDNLAWQGGSANPLYFGDVLRQELSVQMATDQQWWPIVAQMTDSERADKLFRSIDSNVPGWLTALSARALDILDRTIEVEHEEVSHFTMPAHFEQSLSKLSERL